MDDSQTDLNLTLSDIGLSCGIFRRDGNILEKIKQSEVEIRRLLREMQELPMCKNQAE